MTDKYGNTICEVTDQFTFSPPFYPKEEDYYKHLRGRVVKIDKVITHGKIPTVKLKSKDAVFVQAFRDKEIGFVPVSWLRVID